MGFRSPQKPMAPTNQPMSTMDEQKKRQQRGTGFTNISSVLNANKGAGQKMGQAIGSNVAGQAQDIRQGIQAGQSQFQAGKTAAGQTAQTNIGNVSQFQRQANETDADYANRVAQAGGDLTQAGQTFRDTSYSGPMGIENAGQAQAKSANVAALGQLAGNRTGQGELLRNVVANRGGYTRGQAGLDQLLLGKEGQQGLQQARRATAGLGQQTTGAINSAEAQAQGLKSAIEQQKQDVAKGLQTGGTGIQDLAKQQAQQFQTQASRLKELLSGRNASGEQISQLTPEDEQLLNNMDKYGLGDAKIYAGDDASTANTLSNLGNSLTTQFGAKKYEGNQSQAAQNLAKLMGDQATEKQIADSQFDTNVFSKDERLLQPQQYAREQQAQKYRDQYEAPARSLLANPSSNTYDLIEQIAPGTRAWIDANVPEVGGMRERAFRDVAQGLAKKRLGESAGRDWSKDSRLASQDKNLFDVIKSRLGMQTSAVPNQSQSAQTVAPAAPVAAQAKPKRKGGGR